MSVRRVNPAELGPHPGYAHVIEGGPNLRAVFIAGQVPVDAEGQVVGVGQIDVQAKVVFEHLATALASVGASWRDVVRVTTYLRNMDDLAAVRAVREEFYDPDAPPTSTLIEVSRLFNTDFLIEIDAIALVPVEGA